jgi:hypothetical protein
MATDKRRMVSVTYLAAVLFVMALIFVGALYMRARSAATEEARAAAEALQLQGVQGQQHADRIRQSQPRARQADGRHSMTGDDTEPVLEQQYRDLHEPLFNRDWRAK